MSISEVLCCAKHGTHYVLSYDVGKQYSIEYGVLVNLREAFISAKFDLRLNCHKLSLIFNGVTHQLLLRKTVTM